MPADIRFRSTQVINFRLQLGHSQGTPLVFHQGIQSFDLSLERIGDWPQPGMSVVTDALLRRTGAGQPGYLTRQVSSQLSRNAEPGSLIHNCDGRQAAVGTSCGQLRADAGQSVADVGQHSTPMGDLCIELRERLSVVIGTVAEPPRSRIELESPVSQPGVGFGQCRFDRS